MPTFLVVTVAAVGSQYFLHQLVGMLDHRRPTAASQFCPDDPILKADPVRPRSICGACTTTDRVHDTEPRPLAVRTTVALLVRSMRFSSSITCNAQYHYAVAVPVETSCYRLRSYYSCSAAF
jgi:hypothetical protein